jgi:hypothetical protein
MASGTLLRAALLFLALATAGAASAAKISSDGWSLQLPQGSQASFEMVEAQPLYDAQARKDYAANHDLLKPGFENMPAHLRVALAPRQAGADRDTFFAPALYLIPVQSYLSILDPADDESDDWIRSKLAALQQWLAGAPQAVRDWPFPPPLDMSPQYTAQRQALEFGGGRGIRVLTQFVPDVGLAQSGQLSYVFQGLTADGRYYVLLTMPLSLPGLARREDETHLGFGITQLYEDRNAAARYEAAVEALLRKQRKALRPSLAELDALVRSLRWQADAAAPAAQP